MPSLSRDIPLILLAYVGSKLSKRTKVVSLESIALQQAFQQAEESPEEPEERQGGWLRAVSWLWD